MKKSLYFAIAASLMSSSAIANNAGSIGKGYTGTTSDFTYSVLNPSLINNFKENDDFYISISEGIGFRGEELASDVSDSTDLLDRVDEGDRSEQTVNQLKEYLSGLNNERGTIENDFEFLLAFPNKTLSFAIFASQYAKVNLSTTSSINKDTNNADLIQSIEDGNVDVYVDGVGYSVADAGVILGLTQSIYGKPINFGTSLKYQRLDVFKYKDTISGEPEINDNLSDSSGFNVDFGMDTAFGESNEYRFALVAKNLIPKELDSKDGTKFMLDPSITLGAGYYGSWYNLAVELDAFEHTGFKGYEKEKLAKIGGEIDAWGHAKLRAGYMMDLNDSNSSRITAGVRLSPWDFFGVDLAGFVGKDDNVGASLQVSVKI